MAARVNELKQWVLDGKAALIALLQKQGEAKSALASLLQAETPDAEAIGKARVTAKDLDGKVTAGREALQAHEEALHAEEQRLALEDAKIAARSATVIKDNGEDKPWSSFGEQLQAVVAAGAPSGMQNVPGAGRVDPRLFKAGPSGGSTGVASDAGFLVHTDYSTALLEKAVAASVLLPLCDKFEAGPDSDSMEAPYIAETSRATGSRWGGVQVYRRAEADTVTAKKPTLKNFELRLEDMMGLSYLTGREIRDARIMQQVVEKAFQAEFAFKMDDEIFRGNGVGQMTGIKNAACTVEIAKAAGQAAATLVNRNISDMWVAMPTRLKSGSVWFYNCELGPQLDNLSIVAGTAALEPRFVAYGPDGILRIKGRPAIEIEHCDAPGTVGDFVLLNLGEFAVLTKGGLKTDTSIHVRFLYDEMAIRFMIAINGKSKWDSAVAPFKGSVSKSPFVTLAART